MLSFNIPSPGCCQTPLTFRICIHLWCIKTRQDGFHAIMVLLLLRAQGGISVRVLESIYFFYFSLKFHLNFAIFMLQLPVPGDIPLQSIIWAFGIIDLMGQSTGV